MILSISAIGPLRAVDDEQLVAAARGTLYAQPNIRADVLSASFDGETVALDFNSGILDRNGRLSLDGDAALTAVNRTLSNLLLTDGVADVRFFTSISGRPLEDFLEPRAAASARAGQAAPLPKLVALGPGHGYYQHHSLGWTLQRSYYFGIVEDFMNVDFMLEVDAGLLGYGFPTVPLRNFDRNAGNGESGHLKWQESCRTHLKAIGAPSSLWNSDASTSPDLQYNQDIRARPLYANYAGASLFISLHNNGGGGTGTETLYDTTNGHQVESKRFSDIVNAKIISRIRSQYLASWTNRGVKGFNGNYGENRLAECPSVIIEVAFVDRQTPDNEAQRDPVFHQIVGAAIADSVAEFFSQPVLDYVSHQIDDDALEESSGNADGEIDAGETVELKVSLRNSGFGVATGVRGMIAVSDPFITVQDIDTTWADIGVNSSLLSSGDFGLIVSSQCPANHGFTATFSFESNEGAWTHQLPLMVVTAQSADLVDGGASFHNLSTMQASSGQNVTVSGKVTNISAGPAGPFAIRFFASLDNLVTGTDFNLGHLNVGSLAGNSPLPFNVIVTVPASLDAGRYFVGWIIDADGAVAELDEGNNSAALTTGRLAVTTPGSDVQIVSVQQKGGGIEVTFTSKPGYVYALARSEDLMQWTRVFEAIPGDGATISRTDANALLGKKRLFYRVMEE